MADSPSQEVQAGASGQLGVSSLIRDNGTFSKQGDIGATQPTPGLLQRRRRWNVQATKHAALVKQSTELRQEHVMAHLIVTACCMRAWFAGQGLLQPGWIGGPTKSGCDQIACSRIVTFVTASKEQRRRVRLISRV